MENGSNPPPAARSNKWIWIVIAVVVVLCAALVCLILVIGAGVFPFRSFRSDGTTVPEPQILPSAPTVTPRGNAPPTLSYEADPLFGSAGLQRGFLPDPFIFNTGTGGPIDTSDPVLGLDCGFTSSSPTFAFSLTGGASETFLRLFFVASDGSDTTLVVHTPDLQWLCGDHASDGNGMDPVIDIEFAPSGEYAVWVGTWESEARGEGKLFITGSREIAP